MVASGSNFTRNVMGTRDFLFFGHRTSGKSTLAGELNKRGWEVLDVDQLIEKQYQKTCAQIIADDESQFRRTEVEIVIALSCDSHATPRIIVCGAGLEHFPIRPVGVWISRDGWEDSAQSERARLRPEWSFEREIEWMKITREPRYRQAADLHLHIPRGRTVERAADELEDLLIWLDGPSPVVAPRTFMVLPTQEDLARAQARVERLGLTGIEVRSDYTPNARPATEVLASLRTNTPDWLREFPNAPWDIDIQFLDSALKTDIFSLPPRRLVLSAHPESMQDFEYLRKARERIPSAWQPFTELKFAPRCTLDTILPLPDAETFIPQGKSLAWMRHVLCQRNHLNYLPLGLDSALPPLNLQDWLPYWGLKPTADFDALLGQPVGQSQGDWWHRRAAVQEQANRGYLKVPCDPDEFSNILPILFNLGIQNLSITSPLKAVAGEICHSNGPLNTLRWNAALGQWAGKDTDASGMTAALIQASSFCRASAHGKEHPRHAVILGSGAVTPAVRKALLENQWTFEEVPGRSTGAIPPATLLINATGRDVSRPHECYIQLDLHYASVGPSTAPVHLNGDVFFDAQAAEQRLFWFQGV